jgi:hypothetical protein
MMDSEKTGDSLSSPKNKKWEDEVKDGFKNYSSKASTKGETLTITIN